MKIITTDGFEFRFEDALDAFVFDEKDPDRPTFHGAPMKAVDIVAEFEECYVYVELKDYEDPSGDDIRRAANEHEQPVRQDHFKWLKNYLKDKFRDSYLYRHAEDKVDKPIRYVCLINFDNALNSRMQKALKHELPVGKASHRWVRELATNCHVVNMNKWNQNFPKWPVARMAASGGS